ncbi:sensor histidine kinase [Plantactinospora soyae]|uniref:histidine kinase n=1 Tax=Plantactinospora soyae TaxID=1544732 RepID=A0A927QZW4_9ACTN|nr:histidine kinase [Plantactinospora soyae]MBE1489512.1 signal transduction histidine kinase [Plantactinospora soyae]
MLDQAATQPPDQVHLADAARTRILESLLTALERTRNPIVVDARARVTLLTQASHVLDDVVEVANSSNAFLKQTPVDWQETVEVDSARPTQGIHPSASLQAATLLFEAALPVILDELCPADAPSTTGAAIGVALNQAIMRRVAVAAVPYVSFLLKNLRSSHQHERQRVARELHDRAAHGIGIALQSLELSRRYADDPERSASRFANAEEALREAVGIIRSLSAQLRQTVGDATLAEAVRSYLTSTVPGSVRHEVTSAGDITTLPAEIGEELYLIAREAIRNAVLHADMTELRAHVAVDAGAVTITVVDNGRGFDPQRTLTDPASGGLLSMSERAGLLGGVVDVSSDGHLGTSVTITVPTAQAWM